MEKTIEKVVETSVRKLHKTSDIAAFDAGKLPPQAIDLEEAVLGALMLEKEAVNDVIDILSPDSFYKEAHRKIFEAVIGLFQNSQPIDILTVADALKKRGELDVVGGPYYISQLTNRVASAANVEYHARIISQKYILRELIRISSETIKGAYDETTDVFDLLDNTEQNLYSITEGNLRKDYDPMNRLMHESFKQIEKLRNQKDGVSGIPSGFTQLDRVTSGFQNSDLVVIAARPGMGKTAFVLSLARNVAVDFNRPVAVFSLEMSSVQLVNRLIASESEIESGKLRRGNLEDYEWEQLIAKTNKLSEAPLFIDDTPALSVFELRAKCRRLKSQHNVELIIVDYLQLMTVGGNDKNGNREQEISAISRSMKSIAKELNVPILALSQLNRSVETRGGSKRPQLSDLRESGAIEQDADIVSFIYRPEYYKMYEWEDGTDSTNEAEIIIAKHRNGALENIRLKFTSHLAKFSDLQQTFNVAIDGSSDGFEENGNLIRKSKMDDIEDDADAPF
ncbi:MAG: replicative DNA helicase [Flavobacteriales bacterium]|nr:MAG: replicative DNA helicase [Flavobacteriales bacterium]